MATFVARIFLTSSSAWHGAIASMPAGTALAPDAIGSMPAETALAPDPDAKERSPDGSVTAVPHGSGLALVGAGGSDTGGADVDIANHGADGESHNRGATVSRLAVRTDPRDPDGFHDDHGQLYNVPLEPLGPGDDGAQLTWPRYNGTNASCWVCRTKFQSDLKMLDAKDLKDPQGPPQCHVCMNKTAPEDELRELPCCRHYVCLDCSRYMLEDFEEGLRSVPVRLEQQVEQQVERDQDGRLQAVVECTLAFFMKFCEHTCDCINAVGTWLDGNEDFRPGRLIFILVVMILILKYGFNLF